MEQYVLNFGRRLVDRGLLSGSEVARATSESEIRGGSLPQYLVREGKLSKQDVYSVLAEVYEVPFADLSGYRIPVDALDCVSHELAHRFRAVPMAKEGNTLTLAMENPADKEAIGQIAKCCGADMEVTLAAADDIDDALRLYYGAECSIREILKSLGAETKALSHENASRLAELILRQAYEEEASDVHVEPEENLLRIRFRVDGVLHELLQLSKNAEIALMQCFKQMAGLDEGKAKLPQDNTVNFSIHGREVDMRFSFMPTVYGENLVIHLIKDSAHVPGLSQVGLTGKSRSRFEELISQLHGMVLVTGAAGSGKTTTIYAALQSMNTVERNIITVEDTVEYKLPMIRQISIDPKAGLTFSNALKSVLRQDPDIILVGELRDKETAELAIQSALTGHLVFGTLHAGSAAGALTRIVGMGIPPFLAATSVTGVLSQRLVRRICDRCREETSLKDEEREGLGLDSQKQVTCFKGRGCRHCYDTGYRGRIGLFEILVMNEDLQQKIMAGAPAAEIDALARKAGDESMLEDGLIKIESGITSPSEVIRALNGY